MTPGSLSTKLITTQIQHSTATQRDQHLNTSGEPSKPRADLPARPGRRTRGPQLPGQTDTPGPQLSGLKKNTGWGGKRGSAGHPSVPETAVWTVPPPHTPHLSWHPAGSYVASSLGSQTLPGRGGGHLHEHTVSVARTQEPRG